MKKIAIVAAKRTAIGAFLGSLSSFTAPQLASFLIKDILAQTKIDASLIDEVIIGNVLSAGIGQAPARQAAILAGLSENTPATTINKVCASGMRSVMIAANQIACGDAEVILAGGMESMSNVPHYLPKMRSGSKFGNTDIIDGILSDGLTDAYDQQHMGMAAELCATTYNYDREAQDSYAIESYKRAISSRDNKLFEDEITPIEIKDRKGNVTVVDQDEELDRVRFDKIPNLRPAFKKDGTVTAANASSLNDGAAMLLLMSEEKANELGLEIIATIRSQANAAQKPEWFTTAPSKAIPLALEKAKLSNSDIDVFEINEAFSVVCLANNKEMSLDDTKVNVRGGAVSIGHPIGCSGARILVTLCHILKQNNYKTGVAGICNGGGGASAMVLSR